MCPPEVRSDRIHAKIKPNNTKENSQMSEVRQLTLEDFLLQTTVPSKVNDLVNDVDVYRKTDIESHEKLKSLIQKLELHLEILKSISRTLDSFSELERKSITKS